MKPIIVTVDAQFVKDFKANPDAWREELVDLDEMFVNYDYVKELDAVEKRDEFGELVNLWFRSYDEMAKWMASQHELYMHDCIQVRC